MNANGDAPMQRAAVAWLPTLLLTLSTLGALTWGATEFLLAPSTILGDSMSPGLRAGDRVVVDLWSYRHRFPRIGEVVLFDGPLPERPPMVKRVQRIPEAASRFHAGRWTTAAAQADRIWVRGDNAENSRDSRDFGAVPRSALRGRVVFRFWPLRRAGAVR